MKKYFKITVSETEYSTPIVKGYHHGTVVKSSKIYKDAYHEFSYGDKYKGFGTEVISRVQFLKETGEGILLQDSQKTFLEKILPIFKSNIISDNAIKRKIQLVINDGVYTKRDSVFLNDLLKTFKIS